MNNKKKIILSILVMLFLVSVGVAYAFFTYESGERSEIVTGQIYMNYEETNVLSLTNVWPETKAQALARTDENGVFEFTITGRNTSDKTISYEIDLLEGGLITGTTEASTKILPEHVRIYLEKDGVVVVDGETYGDFNNRRIYVGTIPSVTTSNIEHKYTLRMWIDENVTISDTDPDADYTTSEWNNSYTSLKVRVVGNFDPKIMVGEDGQFEYALLSNGKIQITRYLGSETELVIPAEYEGYQVYSIGNPNADAVTPNKRYNMIGATNSMANTTITSVTISEGVEVIDEAAFYGCTGITTVDLPESITEIAGCAFDGCTNWAGTLELPSNLKTIGRRAFNNCKKLTGDLVIPEGVTFIDIGAFQDCTGFNGELTLPSTLEEMGTYAFNRANKLTGALVIPEGIEVIPSAAFQSCAGFTSLTLPSTLTEIQNHAFYQCRGLKGDLEIPEGVTAIGRVAFESCGFDGILTLPSTLEVIEDFAFNHCATFVNTTLDIPTGLRTIGAEGIGATHVFYDFATKTITQYTMNNSTNGVGTYFKVVDGVLYSVDNTRLSAYPANKVGNTYEILEGVTVLDEMAFSRAGSSYSSVPDTGLKTLILPNSFVMNTTLPSNYANTGNNLAVTLYLYTGVNEIAVKDDNPNYKTEDGILYSKDGTLLWYVPSIRAGDIVIPDGVTTIKDGAFYTTGSSVTSLTIPASVTLIETRVLNMINDYQIKGKITIDPNNTVYEVSSAGKIVKKS